MPTASIARALSFLVSRPDQGAQKALRVGLIAVVWSLIGTPAMAVESNHGASAPPPTYRLEEVSIRVSHQPGSGGPAARRVTISGSGTAVLEREGATTSFAYSPRDLLSRVNELYRMRFFDLPEDYRTRYSVFLKEDGSVASSAMRMRDASSTTVCVAIATYEKCVSYGKDGPGELVGLAQRLFADSERLAQSQPVPK